MKNERLQINAVDSYLISKFDLISRISYFICYNMTDEELFRAAEQEKLSKPEILKPQVERMLRDAKSRALVDNFGGHWLQFKSLDAVKPDRVLFTDWNDNLRLSMKRETELFFQHIIR